MTCDVGSGITTTVSTFKSLIGRNKFFDDDNFGLPKVRPQIVLSNEAAKNESQET